MDSLWYYIGITPLGIVGVVVATTVIYFCYVLLLRFWGRQLRASLSVFSVALVTVTGSIAARAMLGETPTLTGGLIALVVLFVWERVFRHQGIGRLRARIAPNAELLMVEGQPLAEQLHHLHFSENLLWTKLRQAGITDRSQVALAILEANGSITIVRSGGPVDHALLRTVANHQRIPEHLVVHRD